MTEQSENKSETTITSEVPSQKPDAGDKSSSPANPAELSDQELDEVAGGVTWSPGGKTMNWQCLFQEDLMSNPSEEKTAVNKEKKIPSTQDKRLDTGNNDRAELTEDELKRVTGGSAFPPNPCAKVWIRAVVGARETTMSNEKPTNEPTQPAAAPTKPAKDELSETELEMASGGALNAYVKLVPQKQGG
jgi:hypothetical protein